MEKWRSFETSHESVPQPMVTNALQQQPRIMATQFRGCSLTLLRCFKKLLLILLRSGMTLAECVDKMALLNHKRRSQRLKSRAAELVTTLSPVCLPGSEAFWQTRIEGRPVRSDLRYGTIKLELMHILTLSARHQYLCRRVDVAAVGARKIEQILGLASFIARDASVVRF
jgi:hypothetical protein